jgi:hypothetical protein
MPQNLTAWGQRLYSPSEGSHDMAFIALKNLSSLAWFEPVNLGTNGKYDNN